MAKDKFAGLGSPVPVRNSGAERRRNVLRNLVEGEKPEYEYIRLDNIRFNPANDYTVRDDDAETAALADDIYRNGLLHNIVVSLRSDGQYLLLSGERRLRAYMLLRDKYGEKYETIYALVRKELSELDELLILDAANLHARGASSDERRFRKATVRFVENLQKKFGADYDEAVTLTKRYADTGSGVIDANIAIEKNLDSSLLAMLDDGLINKKQAAEYAKLAPSVQEVIADNLQEAKDTGAAALQEASEHMQVLAKDIRIAEEKQADAERRAAEVEARIRELEDKAHDAHIVESVYDTVADKEKLREEKEYYSETAKKYREQAETSLAEAKRTRVAATGSADAYQRVYKQAARVQRDVFSLQNKTSLARIASIRDERGEIETLLTACVHSLNDILSLLRGESGA